MKLSKRLWEGVGQVLAVGREPLEASLPQPEGFPQVLDLAEAVKAPTEPVSLSPGAYKFEVASGNYTPPFVVLGAPDATGRLEILLASESGAEISGTPVRAADGSVVVEDAIRVGDDGQPVVWRLTALTG